MTAAEPTERSVVRHEVIICTKDRPAELRRCLAALSRQDAMPVRIVVVDSSESPQALNQDAVSVEIVHHKSEPGLTHQRNIGLALLLSDTEIVHFLDDDAVAEPGYLEAMNEVFVKHPEAAGGGGNITNLPTHVPWRSECFFRLNSRRQGTLLSSGVNILQFDSDRDCNVDWLSGCCMSYRVSAIRDLRFDEDRTGNGIGEDVDFSARAKVRGALVWSPAARVAHLQSSVNRDGPSSVVRRDVTHRWKLARDGVGNVTRVSVIFSTLGLIAISAGRVVRTKSIAPLRSARAAGGGLVDIVARRRA